jgi:hypothetical protein
LGVENVLLNDALQIGQPIKDQIINTCYNVGKSQNGYAE